MTAVMACKQHHHHHNNNNNKIIGNNKKSSNSFKVLKIPPSNSVSFSNVRSITITGIYWELEEVEAGCQLYSQGSNECQNFDDYSPVDPGSDLYHTIMGDIHKKCKNCYNVWFFNQELWIYLTEMYAILVVSFP